MPDFPHSFDAPIVPHCVGPYTYSVVFLPVELNEDLPLAQHPRLRIEGVVGELSFSGALQPVRGRWYLLLSKKKMKAGGFELSEWVHVRFRVADQDAVDVPEMLRLALEENQYAMDTWENLSAGKRRGLAYRVASAKRAPTQTRRVSEVIEMLVLGEF